MWTKKCKKPSRQSLKTIVISSSLIDVSPKPIIIQMRKFFYPSSFLSSRTILKEHIFTFIKHKNVFLSGATVAGLLWGVSWSVGAWKAELDDMPDVRPAVAPVDYMIFQPFGSFTLARSRSPLVPSTGHARCSRVSSYRNSFRSSCRFYDLSIYPCGSPNRGSILDVIANLRLAILVVIVVVEFELTPSLLLFFLFVPPAFVQFLF